MAGRMAAVPAGRLPDAAPDPAARPPDRQLVGSAHPALMRTKPPFRHLVPSHNRHLRGELRSNSHAPRTQTQKIPDSESAYAHDRTVDSSQLLGGIRDR